MNYWLTEINKHIVHRKQAISKVYTIFLEQNMRRRFMQCKKKIAIINICIKYHYNIYLCIYGGSKPCGSHWKPPPTLIIRGIWKILAQVVLILPTYEIELKTYFHISMYVHCTYMGKYYIYINCDDIPINKIFPLGASWFIQFIKSKLANITCQVFCYIRWCGYLFV